jgi:hypothetical protein
MNTAPQSYWFSEMGLWGSTPVETYEFGPEHHANMWHIFDEVHDTSIGDLMQFLQGKPHAYDGEGTAEDWQHVCITCKLLAEDFNGRAN